MTTETRTLRTPTLLEMTQTDNTLDAVRCLYTDPEIMGWHLSSQGNTAHELKRARECRAVAADPRFRFGLEAHETAVVLPMIDAFLEAIAPAVEHVREELRALRAEGYAWSEVWDRAELATGYGFEPGDARALGVAEAGMCPALAADMAIGAF